MATELTFDFNSASAFNIRMPAMLNFVYQLQEGEYTLKIEKKKRRRSLNANAFLWELCNKLSEERSTEGDFVSKEDIYRKAILACGIYKDFEGLSQGDAKTLRHAWELLGTGWITEQVDYMPDGDTVVIRCYYGSSTYNTRQMSRLIDYVVQDCKAVGIDVMTEQERSLLLREWGNEQAKQSV